MQIPASAPAPSSSAAPPATGVARLSTLLRLTWVLLGLGVLAGFPAAIVMQTGPGDAPLGWPVIVACVVAAAVLVGLASRIAPTLLAWLGQRSFSDALWPPLVAGFALRAALLLLAPKPASDGATYMALAAQLAAGAGYGSDGAIAYWPPGLPLLLAPLLRLGLPQPALLLLFGAACLLASLTGLRALMRRIGLQPQAGFAMWGLALWPTHALLSTLPEKELLVLALLLWAVERALFAWQSGRALPLLVLGLLLGAAVLIQPSLQLIAPLAVVATIAFGAKVGAVLRAACIVLLGAVLVIAPWTAHNLQMLGKPVLVSTNGGDVLYRANNELATGVYIPVGRHDLRQLDELSFDRESRRLAWQWIGDHPAAFLKLAAGKFLLFLGDDTYGAYAVFARGGVDIGRSAYLVVKLFSALPWLMLWLAVAGWAASRAGRPITAHTRMSLPGLGLVTLPVIYLAGIHSIFESGPKYHVPLIGVALVLLSAAIAQARAAATAERSAKPPAP